MLEANFEPDQKVAVITGGAGGIGLGMARAFAKAGMSVVLGDIDADRVEAAAEELRDAGHAAIGVRVDVSKLGDVQALAEAAMDTHGRVDVLCNNAGTGSFAKLADTTIDEWEWTLGIDLLGPIHGVNVFQPLIEKCSGGGHINSTSSVAGLVAGAAAGPYNVAKAGVVALMATLEREFRVARSNHTASVLCPGPINTDISRNSVRHRREAGGERSKPSDSSKKLGANMTDILSKGMAPNEVGEVVLDGIVHRRFWIFTHPKLLNAYDEQIEQMHLDRTLSRGRFS